ncbi:MAG: protein kinase [Sneathiella sp.]
MGGEQDLPVGFKIDEFSIERVLGKGGFGFTYLAHDSVLNRHVAIKEYFPSEYAARGEEGTVALIARTESFSDGYKWGLERFIDEAQILARFQHPNVIRVVRYIEKNNSAYIVMDYARGDTLADVIKSEGPLSEERASRYLLQILDGLGKVHEQGLLHRDIKPHNIIIDASDNPVLIDFGAARQAIGAKSKSLSTIVTPGFAPIEQYWSKGNQGPWTDLYALGGVIYACLTKTIPPEAPGRNSKDGFVPVAQACDSQLSQSFSNAIDWMLRVDETERPQDIGALIDVLKGQADPPLSLEGVKTIKASFEDGDESRGDLLSLGRETIRDTGGSLPDIGGERQATEKKSKIPFVIAGGVGILLVIGGILAFQLNSMSPSVEVVRKPEPPKTSSSDVTEKKSAPKPVAEAKPVEKKVVPKAPPKPAPAKVQPKVKPSIEPKRAIPKPAPTTPQPTVAEQKMFNLASKINIPEAYTLYLRNYPDGFFALKARQRLGRKRFKN